MKALHLAALPTATVAALTLTLSCAEAGGKRSRQEAPPAGEKPAGKQEKQFPLGSSWTVVSLNGRPFSGERPSIAVNQQLRATGFSGCNNFSATLYPLRQQAIAVGPLALTRKSCDKGLMQSEMTFLVALRTAAQWDLVGPNLVIKGQNGELRFERSL